jgi:hypothetical protein
LAEQQLRTPVVVGMNLANGLEGSELWFHGVVGTVVASIVVSFIGAIFVMLRSGLFRM